jgi:hypothetical protein
MPNVRAATQNCRSGGSSDNVHGSSLGERGDQGRSEDYVTDEGGLDYERRGQREVEGRRSKV